MVERIVEEFHPRRIYLFGSFAWGNPSADSDIDLMIVVDTLPESPTRMARRAYRKLSGLSYPKDLLFRSTEYFERFASDPASLEYQIVHSGELLYG
ncbi:MAG: nucleotidyltransferase domain-containing protein [Planctomycetes bacterium]|nr:nucleotidyltransferase domain-containing protein [Planctomycetota bacterium]